jgi:D-alanyl-D-alanine carboxypeptidase
MLGTMITTSTTTAPHTARRRRVADTAASLAVLGALLGMAACSSDSDGSAAAETVAGAGAAPETPAPALPADRDARPPTTSAPPRVEAPPTTAAPPQIAPAPTVAADPAHQARLAAILAEHLAAGEFVGARIALRTADGTVTEATGGTPTLDPASGPVDPDVAWNIGSATKVLVATVVLQLADEGRIDLDAGIDRYVPYLRGADQITPRQLLNHTSGLGEYLDQPATRAEPKRQWSPAEQVATAEAAGRFGDPGGPHHYSNTNYIVLGDVIEQVTGRSWVDEVQDRIAGPLGMTHTGLTGTPTPAFAPRDGALVDVGSDFDPSIGGAAGGLRSTSRDLLMFAEALAHGTLVSPELEAAKQQFVAAEDLSRFGIDHGYGLGIERYAMDGMTVIGHMGTGETGSSYVGYDAETGTTVAVTTNTAIPGPAALMAIEALTATRAPG